MLKRRYDSLHMRPDLFGRPILIRQMLYTKINKLLFAGVFEFAVTVTPFAILLVKIAVWLLPATKNCWQRKMATSLQIHFCMNKTL